MLSATWLFEMGALVAWLQPYGFASYSYQDLAMDFVIATIQAEEA